jgi:hypothetical protein
LLVAIDFAVCIRNLVNLLKGDYDQRDSVLTGRGMIYDVRPSSIDVDVGRSAAV